MIISSREGEMNEKERKGCCSAKMKSSETENIEKKNSNSLSLSNAAH